MEYRPPYSPPPRKKRGGFFWFILIVVVLAAIGIGMRMKHSHSLKETTEAQSIPTVATLTTKESAANEEIVLPGNVQPWHEAQIYARTNGYLKSWVRTMGQRVKEGELIATIDTPEIDAQLRQAEANLKTAEANNALAQSTAKRWKKLLKSDSVSKQEAEEKLGQFAATEANLAAAKAERDRLQKLQAFKEVRAPFAGLITSRTTDIGQLINAGSESPQPLFRLVQGDRLRIYVRVPQSYSSQMNKNVGAELHLPEHPNEVFQAKFRASADAIDTGTRTLLVEFEFDNRSGVLLPGGYAEVHLKLPTRGSSLRVPVNTLLFRSEGPRVAVVDAENKAELRPIKIGRDFGNEVEIVDGLTVGEQVIVNPADSLSSGQAVKIATPAEKKEEASVPAPAKPETAEKK